MAICLFLHRSRRNGVGCYSRKGPAMANETNLHRAARTLQQHSELSYQQALALVRATQPRPVLRNAQDVTDFLATRSQRTPNPPADTPESALRQHLRAFHSVETFDDDATEDSLVEFHAWDHETGVMGPDHDADILIPPDAPAAAGEYHTRAGYDPLLDERETGGEALCEHCLEPIEELQDGSGDWLHVQSQRISCDGFPEAWLDENDRRATPQRTERGAVSLDDDGRIIVADGEEH